MNERASGILLHITSLNTKFGIGDFGHNSYEFVDFLSESKQKYWQVLPLNPTEPGYGHSPYSCPSSFAGNPLLISLVSMKEDGYLLNSDLVEIPAFPSDYVDFNMVTSYKSELLKKAFEVNVSGIAQDTKFNRFCMDNKHWLDDYCLYKSIKNDSTYGTWQDFPEDLRNRNRQSLVDWCDKEAHFILYNKFLQFIFFNQWEQLKKYANDSGIKIIGDIPYYINYDSSDVWANQELFKLDEEKNPEFVAGVPPDYFSKTGQLWGNPVYDWDKLKESGYSWWLKRIGHNLSMFDKLRLDHFRGFISYWEIKSGEKTAINGNWVHLDAYDFFDTLFSEYDKSGIIAEDLGIITEDIKELIKHYEIPGMKILLFAFGDDYPYGDYLPRNIDNNCVMYTGTHDNNTAVGWWNEEATEIEKQRVKEYLEKEIEDQSINWELIELALGSRADTAIFPIQDILGLGAFARMNTPSTTKGNWTWKLESYNFFTNIIEKLSRLSDYYDRG